MARSRILLVDDESNLTRIFRQLLEGTGRYIVAEENLGQRALLTAREFHPHLILMDRDLPDKNGIEIAEEMGRDRELAVVPIVFLTGALTRQEAAELGLEGCWRALAKPFTFAELLQVADEVIGEVSRLAA